MCCEIEIKVKGCISRRTGTVLSVIALSLAIAAMSVQGIFVASDNLPSSRANVTVEVNQKLGYVLYDTWEKSDYENRGSTNFLTNSPPKCHVKSPTLDACKAEDEIGTMFACARTGFAITIIGYIAHIAQIVSFEASFCNLTVTEKGVARSSFFAQALGFLVVFLYFVGLLVPVLGYQSYIDFVEEEHGYKFKPFISVYLIAIACVVNLSSVCCGFRHSDEEDEECLQDEESAPLAGTASK